MTSTTTSTTQEIARRRSWSTKSLRVTIATTIIVIFLFLVHSQFGFSVSYVHEQTVDNDSRGSGASNNKHKLMVKSSPRKARFMDKAKTFHASTTEKHKSTLNVKGSSAMIISNNNNVYEDDERIIHTGGKEEVFKERVELDDEKKTITLVGLEGDVLKKFKSYTNVWELKPKDNGCLVNCIIYYEKFNETDPDPQTPYLDYVIELTQEIDAGLTKAS